MFDVFKQLMGALPRERILHVLDEALKKIAVKEVGRARVTEGLARRIQDPEEFGKLFAEGNLDREQLFHILQAQLDSAEIPSTIPMTLVQVGSSSVGESAYAWLCGEEVRNLADLGLTHALVDEGKTLTRTAAPDVTAVNTLETIAALHKIAEIPFVIMFDQLEVFLRSDPDRQESGSSLLKKFIEQLGMQKALLFIAGSDASWRMLPADVAPRMRQRDPIIVGRLSEEETGALLDAYTGSRGTFTSSAVKTIHEVSGVNTREIIRTAHYAFEETDGEVGHDWQEGVPTLVLTTTGRKTGQERKFALIYQEVDGNPVIVASKGGAPSHPGWYFNLVEHPEVGVQVKADKFTARARTVSGEERAKLWDKLAAVWPDYNEYAKKTDREIPVVVLERQ